MGELGNGVPQIIWKQFLEAMVMYLLIRSK